MINLSRLSYPTLIKNKKKNQRIIIIKFDEFVQNPNKYLPKLKEFLNRDFSKKIYQKLKEANCPRKLNFVELQNKKKFLKKYKFKTI